MPRNETKFVGILKDVTEPVQAISVSGRARTLRYAFIEEFDDKGFKRASIALQIPLSFNADKLKELVGTKVFVYYFVYAFKTRKGAYINELRCLYISPTGRNRDERLIQKKCDYHEPESKPYVDDDGYTITDYI